MKKGGAFEKQLDDLNKVLFTNNLAIVKKIPPPLTIVKQGRGAFVTARREKKEWTDYGGTLAGGRAVWFEAKETVKYRFEWKNVQPHQIGFINAHREMGALCFLLVRCNHPDRYGQQFLITPDQALLWSSQGASVTWDFLEEQGCNLICDNWLKDIFTRGL